VERVVLNALTENAPLPPDIRAFGDLVRHRLGEADPPRGEGGARARRLHLRLSTRPPFANQNAPIKVLPFRGILCFHYVDF
jgi:hypothetical protein